TAARKKVIPEEKKAEKALVIAQKKAMTAQKKKEKEEQKEKAKQMQKGKGKGKVPTRGEIDLELPDEEYYSPNELQIVLEGRRRRKMEHHQRQEDSQLRRQLGVLSDPLEQGQAGQESPEKRSNRVAEKAAEKAGLLGKRLQITSPQTSPRKPRQRRKANSIEVDKEEDGSIPVLTKDNEQYLQPGDQIFSASELPFIVAHRRARAEEQRARMLHQDRHRN
ncbi:MAG: hypothetical protein Q9182_007518, partial [Xanthomendoza sp. 2 TL-2023]